MLKIDPAIEAKLTAPGVVTDATFEALVTQSKGAVIVDFWADYCGPCHMSMPLVYKLAHEYAGRVTVLKMDTQENREVMRSFKLPGVPTLLFFLDGVKVDEQVGFPGYEVVREKFDELAVQAGHASTTDTRELAFAAAIAAAEEAFETAITPAADAYRAKAEHFRESCQAAYQAALARKEAGELDEAGLREAIQAAYAPMEEATKDESEAYGAAADVAGPVRYAAIGAAIDAYLG